MLEPCACTQLVPNAEIMLRSAARTVQAPDTMTALLL